MLLSGVEYWIRLFYIKLLNWWNLVEACLIWC